MALNKALGTDLSALAQILKSKGRGRDTVLAHITPQEAALLKKRGGSGTINPDTGLPEFDDSFDYSSIPDVASQQDSPVLSSGGESLSPQQAAAANPNLYGAGQLPTANQTTNFNMPSELQGLSNAQINQYYAQPTDSQGQRPSPAAFTGEYTGDAMGGPASVGPATAYLAGGKELPVESAYQLTPDGTSAQPTDKPTTSTLMSDALKQLKNATPSMSNEALARLGLTGALGVYGAMQGKQATTQNAQATAQKSAIAQPYQQQGNELIRASQAGELTAANQQVIQATRARLNQASSNMGGVGQQQVETQIANLQTQLLNNQYQYGLQVLQIGDNIELGAINTQLQLDQQLNTANRSFYTSLAQLAAGSPMYVPGMYPTTPQKG